VSPRNAVGRTPTPGPTTVSAVHTTEGNRAFAPERSASAGTPRRSGDLVSAGQLLVSVMRELFAAADQAEDGGAA